MKYLKLLYKGEKEKGGMSVLDPHYLLDFMPTSCFYLCFAGFQPLHGIYSLIAGGGGGSCLIHYPCSGELRRVEYEGQCCPQ